MLLIYKVSFLSVTLPTGAQNPLKKGTSTTSSLKAKLLFIRVLLASEPAQYALLRVQRYILLMTYQTFAARKSEHLYLFNI